MQDVLISTPAMNMLESLHDHDQAGVERVVGLLRSASLRPEEAQRLAGYSDTFVKRTGNYRVIFRMRGADVEVVSVLEQDEDRAGIDA